MLRYRRRLLAFRSSPVVWSAWLLISAVAATALSQRDGLTIVRALLGGSFAVMALVPICIGVVSGRRLLDDPIYVALLTYALFIGIGPAIPIFTRALGQASLTLHLGAVVASWLGAIAMVGGYACARSVRRAVHRLPAGSSDQFDPAVLRAFSMLYTALGVLGVALCVIANGGLTELFHLRYGGRAEAHLTSGLTYEALRAGLFLAIASVGLSGEITLVRWALLTTYILWDLLWFGPIHGSRNQVITIFLSSIFLISRLLPSLRGIKAHAQQAALTLLCLSIVIVWGAMRATSTSAQFLAQPLHAREGTEWRALALTLYAPYDTLSKIVRAVPDDLPYQYGATFLEGLTAWVPRSIWADKPAGLGLYSESVLYQPTRGNSVATWPGELYWDFGLYGVVLGAFALGAFCGAMALTPADRERPARALLYGVTFPIVLPWIWGGSAEAAWYFYENILPVGIAIYFARRSATARALLRRSGCPHFGRS